jgi:PAS domain S-box-containing protein
MVEAVLDCYVPGESDPADRPGSMGAAMTTALVAPLRHRELADPGSLARVLLDRMTEGVSLSREDGTIIYTNPAEDRLFGYEPGELWGQHVSVQNAYPPEENARVVSAVIAELKRSGAWSGEWRNRRKDGTEFITRARISTLEIGGEHHWLCVQEDVTEEVTATRELHAERARLKLATDAGSIGVWDWDLATGRMTYSDHARAISGLPATGEITIDDVRRTVHPADYPRTSEQARRAVDPAFRDRSPYEYRIVWPDGSVRWVVADGEAVFEDGPEGPRAVRYLGTIRDITGRRELEEAERDAAQQLKLALGASGMGVWDLDVPTGLVTGSPRLHQLLGFPEGEPIRAEEANARYAPGEQERVSAAGAEAFLRGEMSGEAEFAYDHPDRGRIWLRLRYEIITSDDGLPVRVIGVISDETERRESEDRVRASEEELRALADALPLLVSFVGRDQRYRFMNRAHEEWFGRPREEMLGRTIREVLGEEAYAPRQPHLRSALRGRPSKVEVMTPGRDSLRRDTEVHYLPRHDARGRVDGVYAVVLDLTEQKDAQRALERAREEAEDQAARTGAILSQLAEGVIVADAAGRITFVNEAAARIHGVARLGVTPNLYTEAYQLLTEDGQTYPHDELPLARAALRGERVEEARWRIRRPDGTEVLAVGSARPIRTPDGQQVGAVLTLRDDTARAKAEEELRRLNQDLEAEVLQRTAERDRIWQNSNELMAVFGFDGRRRSINPAWSQLLGHDEDLLLSTPFTDLTHPEDRPRLLAMVDKLRRGERVTDFEDRLRHRDGSYRTVSWTGVPGDGVFYAIGRDVTEQRRAEQALRQSQKMEALGQLTGGIAHDFNNLLQAVQGSFSLILRQSADAERVRDLAQQGLQATRRGGSLASQLLAFSRSQKLEVQSVPVAAALSGMKDLLQRSIGPLVGVTIEPADPDLRAEVDPTQLEMAVLNLAINARDAMPDGGRVVISAETLKVTADPDLQPGDYVVVRVEDTGTGMPEEVAQRAFEPFFTTKSLGKGTGLGLSQVYAMARQSGGTVRLDSRPGAGTTVHIFLRRAAEGQSDEQDPSGTHTAAAPSSPAATILVIDDDDDVRTWLLSALGLMGHRAVGAANGAEGLSRLDCDPDLVIVDFAMPEMTGAEVVRALRRTRPDLPVILATGYADTGEVETVTDPRLDVLRKPFELDELEATLRARLLPRGA